MCKLPTILSNEIFFLASSTILSVINQERLRSNNEEQNINIHNYNEEDEDIVEVSFIQGN